MARSYELLAGEIVQAQKKLQRSIDRLEAVYAIVRDFCLRAGEDSLFQTGRIWNIQGEVVYGGAFFDATHHLSVWVSFEDEPLIRLELKRNSRVCRAEECGTILEALTTIERWREAVKEKK